MELIIKKHVTLLLSSLFKFAIQLKCVLNFFEKFFKRSIQNVRIYKKKADISTYKLFFKIHSRTL